jgi:outer membrane protein assembly factor BamB
MRDVWLTASVVGLWLSWAALVAADDGTYSQAAIPAVETSAAGSGPETTRVGEDWPVFLGPRGDGVSGETGLVRSFPKGGPPVVWKKRIGTGYTAPSVVGNTLVFFHRQRDEEIVEAVAADTGKPLWRQAWPTNYEDPYGYNNGPRCTPLLTKTRCYVFGAEGMLVCLDLATGQPVWKRDTAADFRVPMAFFGVGSTPILEGNRLIAMVGGLPDAGLVAFDAETGKTLWQSVGLKQFTPPLGFRVQKDDKLASYSSPFAVTLGGKRQILALLRPGFVSVDPETGAVIDSLFFRAQVRESVNAARPVVVGDRVFLSAAYEAGAVLLKAKAGGKGFDEVWRDVDAMQNHWSTSIFHQGVLYGFSGRHEVPSSFRAIDFGTGKLHWQTEDPFEKGVSPAQAADDPKVPFYGRGSAILADGKLICLSEWGHLGLVEVRPDKCVELARYKVPELRYPSWAAPVLSRGRVFLRDENWLIGLDLLARDAVAK